MKRIFFKQNAEGDLYPYGFWDSLKSPWKEFLAFGIIGGFIAFVTLFPLEVYLRFTEKQRVRESANLQAFVDRYECTTVLVGRYSAGRTGSTYQTTTMRCAKLGPDSIAYSEIFERAQVEGAAGR
jgi:hypothetical protein